MRPLVSLTDQCWLSHDPLFHCVNLLIRVTVSGNGIDTSLFHSPSVILAHVFATSAVGITPVADVARVQWPPKPPPTYPLSTDILPHQSQHF